MRPFTLILANSLIQSNEADWPLWLFTLLVMAGVITSNERMIALPTLVDA